MAKRRGKRVVVGYVVSHTGKRGGPWEAPFGHDIGTATSKRHTAFRTRDKSHADRVAHEVAAKRTHARALPLVRYEVDAEEERLRDAVVEAADHLAGCLAHSDTLDHDQNIERKLAGQDEEAANADLRSCVNALRAHREKVGGHGLARKGDRDG